MSTYKLNIGGNPYDVKILSIKNNQAEVDVNGMVYNVDVAGMNIAQAAPAAPQASAPVAAPQAAPAPAAAPKKSSAPAVAGANDISAPMPGSIIKILVSEGDSVNAGDPIVIMEAMKMENEVSAAASGSITKIHIKVGDTVEQGALLISIG